MESKEYTRISAEVSGREKITCEFPTEDITVGDMCQAFRTIMVGLTFADDTAGRMLADYLEEYYGDLFNIEELNNQ